MNRRRALTAVSLGYLATIGVAAGRVPLQVFNQLLVTTVGPLVWLIWVFCRWSAHQHANRWARDIQKVHGGVRQAVRR